MRNAFLGKFSRDDIRQVDNAIEKVKEAKVETENALNVSIVFFPVSCQFLNSIFKERQKLIKASERQKLEEKMKIHLKAKKQQRGKQEKKKGKKKKNKQQQQQEQAAAQATAASTDAWITKQ